MRRALVLSGGGSKGSVQVGALEELIVNRGLDFEILCGVSVGALNAAFLAQAPLLPAEPAQSLENLRGALSGLREIWLDDIRGNRSVYSVRLGKRAGILLGADSIYDSRPLRELLRRRLSAEALARSGRTLSVQYVSLETGELRAAARGDRIVDQVLASATMPYYFPPVRIGGESLVDGGVRDITPLGQAFAAGADLIYVVYASPAQLRRRELEDDALGLRVKAFDLLARAVEIMLDEIHRTDTEEARRLNVIKWRWDELRALLRVAEQPLPASVSEGMQRMDEALDGLRYAPIVEIRPLRHIIADSLDFTPAGLQESYRHGLEVAGSLGETP